MFGDLYTERKKKVLDNDQNYDYYSAVSDKNNKKSSPHMALYTTCHPNKEFYLKEEGITMTGAFATSGYTTTFKIAIQHEGKELECPKENKSQLGDG